MIYFEFYGMKCSFDPVTKRLITPIGNLFFKPSTRNYERRIYIIFSKKCNLKCTYCFQKNDVKNDCAFSESDIYNILKNEVDKFDEIVLFGGEPFISENINFIKKLLNELPKSNFIVFTNGNYDYNYNILLSQHSDQFNCVVFTIDGIEEIHNRKRINKQGNSFKNAIENLVNINKLGIHSSLQINVYKNNINYIDDFMDYLLNSNIIIDHIELNPVKYVNNALTQRELLTAYFSLKKKYKFLNISLNNRTINNLVYLLTGNDLFINRCGLNTSVVCDFSTKQIYACPQNESSIIGSITNDKLVYSHSKIFREISCIEYSNSNCKNCELNYLCSYGCPYEILNYDNCKEELLNNLQYLRKTK